VTRLPLKAALSRKEPVSLRKRAARGVGRKRGDYNKRSVCLNAALSLFSFKFTLPRIIAPLAR
jgi:hypothetical protein